MQDILLDIEGTTSSVSFVHDVLFPYARARLGDFVAENADDPKVAAELARAKESVRERGWPHGSRDEVVSGLVRFIDEDVKDTALKALQGMVWRSGYETVAYRAHFYPEVPDALRRWRDRGLRLSVYSSGSVEAQKLFFRYAEAGDLTGLVHAHFDTTAGPKREAGSYRAIAAALARPPEAILFLSDVPAELDAAAAAGLRTAQLVRPGTTAGEGHPSFPDFDAVERQLL